MKRFSVNQVRAYWRDNWMIYLPGETISRANVRVPKGRLGLSKLGDGVYTWRIVRATPAAIKEATRLRLEWETGE